MSRSITSRSNIQGDFIDLNVPNSGVTGSDTSLNSDIFVTHSTFHHCGYHGLTIESADGVAFSQDAFSRIGTDAMDFEYDVYSTTFDAQGNPQEAAQDNVRIINDTWSDFGGDWFASLQGQLPGVQEQNVVLSGNTINAHSPLVEIVGTNPYLTSSQYWNIGLTIADNTSLQGAIPIRGGSITTPFRRVSDEHRGRSEYQHQGQHVPDVRRHPRLFPRYPVRRGSPSA